MTDKSPDRITPGKSTEPLSQSIPSGKTPSGFDTYMQGTGTPKTPMGSAAPPAGLTPMDASRGPSISASGLSFNTLLAQANQTQDSLGTVEQQLGNQNLKLKRSQSHLVKQKLGDANSYIRTAGSKLGLELPEGKLPPGVSGVSRFIAMINDGQDQLAQVQEMLKKLSASGDSISPGDMMSIQVKMGLAQQEISYTSTLLGKVIQSITQLMNTQL
ncbi:MAG: hypothetical protein WCF19_02305 [Chlamydiales bacterium]